MGLSAVQQPSIRPECKQSIWVTKQTVALALNRFDYFPELITSDPGKLKKSSSNNALK